MSAVDDADAARYDPRLWPASHPITETFDKLAEAVRQKLELGLGQLASFATEAEKEFQESRLAKLEAALGFRSNCPPSMPLDIFAMRICAWDNPVAAILYAASQAAAHHALRDSELDEPGVNSSLYENLPVRLEALASAYKQAGCVLPPKMFLHAGAAKMERTKDHMGADLALVVGANVLGIPRFRIVLLQAKHADKNQRNRAGVGQNQGRQLDELLSTGMGYYLFYPRVVNDGQGRDTRLLPLVRDARNVFADVARTTTGAARYMVGCHASRDGYLDALDLAQFFSLTMASDELTVGRLFPSVATAAAALVVNGKPLAPQVLVVDRTGRLSVMEFLRAMNGHRMKTTANLSFPAWEELKPDHDEDNGSSPAMW